MQTTFPDFAKYMHEFSTLSAEKQAIVYQDLAEKSALSPQGLRYRGYPFTSDDCRHLLRHMEHVINRKNPTD